VVAHQQPVTVFVANQVALFPGTVFHHNDLKILESLVTKALQQFVDFLRPIVDRYDD